MQHRIENRTAKYQFDSLSEVGSWIDATPATWTYKESHTARATAEWDLSAGYVGALRMAKEGWLEGAQRAQEALKVLTPKQPHVALRTDFYGHLPHVARFCAGAPDSMIRHHKEPTIGNGRVLTLYVPISANCGAKARYMANFGIGLVHYIDQLEQDGIRVELYGCLMTTGFSGKAANVCFAWRVKSADQPVDLATLAFTIGHPASFRRIGFALIERSCVGQKSSYGHADDIALAHLLDTPTGAYVLNGLMRANTVAQTPAAATAFIAEQIERALEVSDAGSYL